MSHAILTILDPRWAEISGSPEALAAAADLLWYYPEGYRYDPRFRRGIWDGKASLLLQRYFPAGLAAGVAEFLQAGGIQVELRGWPHGVQGYRQVPRGYHWADDPGPLRPYQAEAVAVARAAGRGVLQLATGAGKTEIIARLVYEYNAPALVICNTRDLLHQTAERLTRRLPGARVGMVGDGYADFSDITVALFQTLAHNLDGLGDAFDPFVLVISDEAHHNSATSYQAVMNAIPAPNRFGFSATPYLGEEKAKGHTRDLVLEGQTGPCLFRYDSGQAAADGYLILPTVFIAEYPKTVVLPAKEKNWARLYGDGIVRHEGRNQTLATYAATAAGEWGKTLVLCKEVAHAERMAALIQGAGVEAPVLDGRLASGKRARLLARFREDDELRCLVATGLLDEGVDVPAIAAVVLASGGRADHKLMQRVGRGMRKGGQERLVVIDSDDNAHPILAYHSRRRQSLYQREGWPVERIQA